jgi:predicted nuclease of predicted toxin-antitoxin system
LDENLAVGLSQPFADAGHDVTTVSGQSISGCEDQSLYEVCRTEQRILVTLDMDFANPLRFPPEVTAGIIVLRPPRPLLSLLRSSLSDALVRIETESTAGKLWIVELTNIRIYEPDSLLSDR